MVTNTLTNTLNMDAADWSLSLDAPIRTVVPEGGRQGVSDATVSCTGGPALLNQSQQEEGGGLDDKSSGSECPCSPPHTHAHTHAANKPHPLQQSKDPDWRDILEGRSSESRSESITTGNKEAGSGKSVACCRKRRDQTREAELILFQ